MPWYARVLTAIQSAAVPLAPTQATNLALLTSAILAKRTLCLSELARAYPTPAPRRVAQPKHDLLHRVKRLWRFLENARVDPVVVQTAFIPHTLARLGPVRCIGLAMDWTMFDTTLPRGKRMRYQVLRIAIPRRGRALPLLPLAYDRQGWKHEVISQNQAEEAALGCVLHELPPGVHAVVLADRGFARASFLTWLQPRGVDYVVRINRGTVLTEADGRRWKLGSEDLQPGQLRLAPGVRFGLYHDRPRDLAVNVALCWRIPKGLARDPRRKPPPEPWYLATSLVSASRAVAWYWQRGWIEQSFKDSKQRFGLAAVQVGTPERLNRLLMALTLALAWLTLIALPEVHALPARWARHVAQFRRLSLIGLALAWLEERQELPLACLPAHS
jgi:hypothetical protein